MNTIMAVKILDFELGNSLVFPSSFFMGLSFKILTIRKTNMIQKPNDGMNINRSPSVQPILITKLEVMEKVIR